MVEIEGLAKAFGRREVLRGIDLVVKQGEFVIIMGPNGAGKTTLLRIIATIIKPDRGRIKVCGFQLPEKASEARRKVGLLTHSPFLYDELTARENLLFYASLFSVPEPERRSEELLSLVGLEDRKEERVRTFSRGMLQRLAIARALLHDPQLLLLDEPFTGLDQKAAEVLLDLLKRLPMEKRTVIMTTHQVDEVLALAHRVLILHKGWFVMEVPGGELEVESFRKKYIEVISS
ncbi:MAG: heme ABC exporter ATP-binding protein CcmA [Anaerolineae bacterium]|nr:heme ABC exporter ATP-binding protein CcmA [Anaerolineae bacterium]MDW8103005.1 heme ABC exporter ATP-binding protein CcmA [Anaerolineae bacterium]